MRRRKALRLSNLIHCDQNSSNKDHTHREHAETHINREATSQKQLEEDEDTNQQIKQKLEGLHLYRPGKDEIRVKRSAKSLVRSATSHSTCRSAAMAAFVRQAVAKWRNAARFCRAAQKQGVTRLCLLCCARQTTFTSGFEREELGERGGYRGRGYLKSSL